jgi:hypothetical protein
MAKPDFTIRVERIDSELLVIDGLALARGFFTGDPGSIAEGGYDSLAGHGNPHRIEVADIVAINTMRAQAFGGDPGRRGAVA